MGHGQTKGWPPTGVVTIVLAGGRIEEHRRPISAGDLMLLHPLHHVVNSDFFRSSPVVILGPDEMLRPGHKFFLVPFRTVYKRLRSKAHVLDRSSSSNSGKSPTSGGWARMYQTEAIKDTSSCGLVCRNYSVGVGKKGSARGSAGGSPSGRASPARKKSSPTTTLKARRRSQSLRVSMNARKRPPIDAEDNPRWRTSPQLQIRKQDESSADLTEIGWIGTADFMELEPFRTEGSVECNMSKSPLGVMKQVESLDMSNLENESFMTPEMRSPQQGLEPFESATASVDQELEFFEAMDFCESEKSATEPLLAPVHGIMQEMMDFRGPASGQSVERSRETRQPIAPSVSRGSESVRDIIQAWEDKPKRKEELLNSRSLNKPPRSSASLEWRSLQEILTVKIALHAQQAVSHSDRHNGLGQPPSTPTRERQLFTQELERSGLARSHSARTHNGFGQQPQSSPARERQLARHEPERSLTRSALARSHCVRTHNGFGQQPPSTPARERQLASQEPERSLTRSARITRSHSVRTHNGVGQQPPWIPSTPARQKELSDKGPERSLTRSARITRSHSVGTQNGFGQQPPSTPARERQLRSQEPNGSLTTIGNALTHRARYDGMETQLLSQEPKRSMRSNPQQQQQEMEGQVGCLQELQVFCRRAGYNKLVKVKPLFKSSAADSQVEPKPRLAAPDNEQTGTSVQQQAPMTLTKALANGLFESSADPQVEQKPVQAAKIVKQPEMRASVPQQSPMTLIEVLGPGMFESSPDAQVEPKPVAALVKQQGSRASVQQQRSPMTLVKRKPYRYKLIQSLCFSSSQVLQSPLHVSSSAAGRSKGESKTRAASRLKLSDHLKLDPSPGLNQNDILKQPASTRAKNVPQLRQFPMPQSVNRRDFEEVRKEFLTFQLTQAVKNQSDPSALSPKDVNKVSPPKTSIEDKFLKVPPVGLFRSRRIRNYRRRHFSTVTNWKPKLSPLVEFSP